MCECLCVLFCVGEYLVSSYLCFFFSSSFLSFFHGCGWNVHLCVGVHLLCATVIFSCLVLVYLCILKQA